ncbi:Stp1/IreP family PP2C-type Ser/Thr phosphatase [Dysosmobacter sp.]|uniref:Stp1/IreP family PP2C-type Ser/Thr phosphatase n=1 Tax=Dysosmobacter sp. TaxID=2591382 RepID=UPI002A8981B0|nr:Stp1/IreP family PP2C-type Ser/Thr phosphatase [Dysosmobacter sp.]MDY3282397.1 Stp1/IreP family PP2C-type Ser/Thr phosphatase [Dysosmobacter sp.]
MKVWEMTDIGLARKDNQDAYGVELRTETGHTICVVCDGMGGAAAGQLASQLAVSTFLQELKKVLTAEMTPEQLREASSYAVSLANRSVYEKSESAPELRGMGTTLVSAVTCGGSVVISNVGDSRAYRVTPDGITRITKDHSLVESMVDRGDITAEEARRHPNRNLITRALGPDPVADCDGYITPLNPGEYILLCTDGLIDTVTDQEMLFEIIHGDGQDTCLQRLLEIAKAHGAPDNVTAVLMQQE